jgi:hypothetical protein
VGLRQLAFHISVLESVALRVPVAPSADNPVGIILLSAAATYLKIVRAITYDCVRAVFPGQKPRALKHASPLGRGPSGQWYLRSLSLIGASLMLEMRRRIRPFASNSQFSLP